MQGGKGIVEDLASKMSGMEKPEQVVILRAPRTEFEHTLFQNFFEPGHISSDRL